MPNRPKRKLSRRTIYQLRALYVTITSVILAIVGAALSVLATIPSIPLTIFVFVVIVGMAVAGYAVTFQLLKLDYREKRIERAEAAQEVQQQQDDMEAAMKRAMVGAFNEILQSDTLGPVLKEAIREAIREESAHANLADKTPEIDLPKAEDDETADTSQQNT